MLELTIEEKPKPKPTKHLKECFWQDRAGNISVKECPWCAIMSK
jgi:hypothetical protein